MPADSDRYAFGPFVLDLGERRLTRLGACVAVSDQALDLLALLARHTGRLVSKDELMGALWPGAVPEDNALTVAISKLRTVLGADGRALIETVRGRGYRLATPVLVEDGAAGSRPFGLGSLRKLAVRPFAPLAPEAAPLAEGLHEAVAAALAALGIDARPALFDDADAVLSGDAQGAGGRVRAAARLTADDGRVLWSRTVTARADALDGRDTLAAEIAEALALRLAAAARARHVGTAVMRDAPLAFHQARFHWARRMAGQAAAALAAFEAATEAAPGFAPAWTGLAEVLVMLSLLDGTPTRETFPRARVAAERALALAPASAEPLVPLAHVAWRYEFDAAEGERLLRLALAREPHLLDAGKTLGLLLTLSGHSDEGLALLDRLLRLHPDEPEVAMEYGYAAFFARRYGLAEAQLRAFLARVPGHAIARLFLGKTLAASGRVAEGLAEIEGAVEAAGPHPVILADFAWVLAAAGRVADARAALTEAEHRHAGPLSGPSMLAPAYAALGEREAALGALERAIEERDPMLIHLHAYAGYDLLRDEPRFHAVARRIGKAVGSSVS